MWTFLPLGWRVHQKVVQIIREEMDAIGGQEMLMPVLTPPSCGSRPAAIAIPEIFHLEDRSGRDFVLPMTHEETVTFHAKEIRATGSCRSCSTTSRSRSATSRGRAAGSCGVREFIMKDAYSFDRDEAGLDVELPQARGRLPPDLPALRARVLGRRRRSPG